MLLMIVGGIALTQAVSDAKQVTLRWLRLGGVISVSLLAVAVTVAWMTRSANPGVFDATVWVFVGLAGVASVAQLVVVQLAYRRAVVYTSLAVFIFSILSIFELMPPVLAAVHAPQGTPAGNAVAGGSLLSGAGIAWSGLLTPGLLGGFLMAMLLGHAYLTAGNEMTQAPFRRLVLLLAGLLVLRAVTSGWFGLWPYLLVERTGMGMAAMWNTVMVAARYAVGLVVPVVFIYMVDDCVRRRANQSATGILYVATVLVMLGEGIAFSLLGSTGYAF